MAERELKPTTWPWIVTALLSPLLLASLLAMGYMTGERKRLAAETQQSVKQFERQAAEHKVLQEQLNRLVALSGVGSWKPDASGKQTAPENIPVPNEQFTPMMTKFTTVSPTILNSATNSIANMRAEVDAIYRWRDELDRTLAFMIYGPSNLPQIYTINRFMDVSGAATLQDEAQVKTAIQNLALLRRPDLSADGNTIPTDLLNEAYDRYRKMEATADPMVSASLRPTFETVVRLQRALMDALSAYSDDAGSVLWGETDAGDPFNDQVTNLNSKIGTQEGSRDSGDDAFSKMNTGYKGVETLMDEARSRNNDIRDGAVDVQREIDDSRQLFQSDMESLTLIYQNMLNAARLEERLLVQLLKRNRKISDYQGLRWNLRSDGELAFVNNNTRVCHINLGAANNVHQGMRFEVWRFTGAGEADQRIGMVEVLRALDDHYALCTILDERMDEGEPIALRAGDTLVNRLWDNGHYLNVSLAGTLWGGTFTHYGKDALTTKLRALGVKIQDDIQINTDLVILGGGRKPDQAYQDARSKIDFEELTEDAVRLYVDPR